MCIKKTTENKTDPVYVKEEITIKQITEGILRLNDEITVTEKCSGLNSSALVLILQCCKFNHTVQQI